MPLTERNKMTDREKKCKDLVSSEWKDRQKDLTKEDFEGLSFDYVEANTFDDQKEGYWRWQFSWGGPSDELRAYVNRDDSMHRLEYWYMDWFDGAKVNVAAEHPAWQKMQEMILHTAPGQLAHAS
tara:strand:- start:12 stop:386 length:375 start_codon:yes stop_codon:yes gene_type:complete